MENENAMQSAEQPGSEKNPGNKPQQGQQPTDKEQENYKKVVLAGLKILYSDETHQGVMKLLQSAADEGPAVAIASVAAMVITQLDDKAGGKIPEDVILPAAAEILTEVARLASAAGVFEVDESVIKEAMTQLTQVLAMKYSGGGQESQPGGQPQQPAGPDQGAAPVTGQQRPGMINNAMPGGV